MENLLIPLDNYDITILESVSDRLKTNKKEFIEVINEKEFIRYDKIIGIIESLVGEVDRLQDEYEEVSQELFNIGR